MNQRSFSQYRVIERDARDRMHNRLCEALGRLNVTVTEPLLKTEHPGGMILSISRNGLGGGTSTPVERYPFELLWQSIDSGTLANTFYVNSGTIACGITLHPANDTSFGSPTAIVVPASSSLYKIWLKLSITAATGAMTAVAIDSSLAGWAVADGDAVDYPTNAPASAGAGLAPTKLYILLAEITTTAAGAWTLFPTTLTSLGAAKYLDTFTCPGTLGFAMAWWRV